MEHIFYAIFRPIYKPDDFQSFSQFSKSMIIFLKAFK